MCLKPAVAGHANSIIDTTRVVCGARSMKLPGVCPSHGAVFKGGEVTGSTPPPPEMLRRKFFGSVKMHAQRNASADAVYVCTVVMPGKAIWRP